MEHKKTGTTTVGLICKDGVVLGSERKATIGYMIDSKVAQKVHKLDDHIGMTIAGSVGDAYALIRLLKAQFKLYRLERGPITVKAAATLLSNILQGSKWMPFMNQLILGGYDASGPHVYSLDPVGGWSSFDNYYSTGSGSPFAYGVLESEFKENMPVDDAIGLVLKALKSAVGRDIASGGNGFLIAIITADGYKELSENEIKKHMK